MDDVSEQSVEWALVAAAQIRSALPPATVAEFAGRALPDVDRIALGEGSRGAMVLPMGGAGFAWGSGGMRPPGSPEFSVGPPRGADAHGGGPERPVEFLLGGQPLWLAHRLHGACELAISQLVVPQFPEFGPRPGGDGARMVVAGWFGTTSPLEHAFAVVHQLRPDVLSRTSKLAEVLIGRMSVSLALPEDQSPIVTALGLRHLSGAIVAAAAVVTAQQGVLPDHPFDRVVMAVGLQVACQLLERVSVPSGIHAEGVRARRRSGYLLPRSSHVQQWLPDGVLYVLEPGRQRPPAPPSFAENVLVESVPGGFAIRCAEGPVQLNVNLLVHEEPQPSVSGFESVEFSWTAEIGGGRTPDLQEVMPPWPGIFRIRVTTHGRDSGMPHLGIAVWEAEQWEPTVVDATDSLGASLRGEHPPANAEPVPYVWVADTRLGDAATVTVVRGASLADVGRAFGIDEPVAVQQVEGDLRARVILLPVDDGVLAVELNQWQGSRPEVLGPVSEGTVAASLYWSVNRSETLSLAENGEFLVAEETMGEPQDPRIAALMPDAEPEAYEWWAAYGFRALQRFTGIEVTPDVIERVFSEGRAFQVLPQLEASPSFGDRVGWFGEEPESPAVEGSEEVRLPSRRRMEAMAALDPEVLTELAWELVAIVAEGQGLLDDPVIAEVLQQRVLTPRGELVIRQTDADLDIVSVRASVLQVARSATNPDPAAAVAAVLTSHRWSSEENLRALVAAVDARIPPEQ